jgi:hypothetical protein
MENPFLQTGLLLHGNVPLAEDQNREAGGISLSRAKEPREKHTFSRSLTVKIGERLTGSVRSRENLRGGGNFRLHAAAQRDTRISSCSGYYSTILPCPTPRIAFPFQSGKAYALVMNSFVVWDRGARCAEARND